jgi:hypothetical protein
MDNPNIRTTIVPATSLALMRRAEIDADLAEMERDTEYQAEVLQMETEFALAQWEALQTLET